MSLSKAEEFNVRLQSIAEIAKNLSHPARLAILEHLQSAGACVTGDLSEEIPLGRTTVFQHLTALKQAGWIKGEIKGSKICYCLDHHRIKKDSAAINEFLTHLHLSPPCQC